MTLTEFFKAVTGELTERNITFAMAGGIVASYYRKSPRATHDLDILILSKTNSQKDAENIIKSFDLKPYLLRKAELESGPMFAVKKQSTPVYIVAGRPQSKIKDAIGLDILLPAIPWAANALSRGQDNKVDFGFGPIPCLTVEDLIIAKLYALKNQATRFMDLDDLKSIFESDHKLNLDYLCGQLKGLELTVPSALKAFVPRVLNLVLRS